MSWAAVGSAAVAVGGSYLSSKKNAKNSTSTQQQQMDPRITELLLGNGGEGSKGLLQQWAGASNPMTPGQTTFGQTANNYLQNYGGADTNKSRDAIYAAINGNQAPQAAGAGSPGVAQISTSQVNAPAQNGINLSGTFNSLLGGGNNAALMQSLQAGNALTAAQQQQNQSNMTDNLQRNVLPGIRSGAIASGQYGGSRQGIAEGNAISDFTKQLNSSNTQLGLANSANTAAQLANAYESGQNRSLAAAQGLSGQQYGVASQNASLDQAAQMANMNADNQIRQFNAGQQQQNNQFNAGQQLQTNNQNTSAALAGSGLLSSQLQQQYANATNANNYGLNQAQQLSGILSPYAGVNGSSTQTSPYYSNTGASLLGGAAAGLGLYNQFQQSGAFNGNSSTPNAQNITPWSG